MSKAKLIELIKMSDHDLEYAIADFTLPEGGLDAFRMILTQALKEQDRDTRHGCAVSIVNLFAIHLDHDGVFCVPFVMQDSAQQSCINYQDKDLKRL